jgi:hypothetical protein
MTNGFFFFRNWCIRMAAATSHHTIVSIQSHRWNGKNSSMDKRAANVRLVSVASCCSGTRKLGLVCASGSTSSVIDPVRLLSNGKGDHTPKKSSNFHMFIRTNSFFRHKCTSLKLLSLFGSRRKYPYIDPAWWIDVEWEESVYWLRRCASDTDRCRGGHRGR